MVACQQWRAISLSVPPPVVVVLRSEDGFENDGDKAEYDEENNDRNDVCHMMSFLFPVTFQILVHRLVDYLTQRHICWYRDKPEDKRFYATCCIESEPLYVKSVDRRQCGIKLLHDPKIFLQKE